jgi:hypothetical protein
VFVPSNAGLGSIQGGYRRAQGGAGKLADMVKERGESQRDEWHGGVLWLGMMKFLIIAPILAGLQCIG